MDIQVRIHSEGALRNQRFAFTDRYTLISELLQNARRAGATLVELSHDVASQTLRVRDDGCGIDDFQKLLTFHDSGWGAETQQHEHAFGVGFSKCLYAATRCIVSSNGQVVDIDTSTALAQQPVAVRAISAQAQVSGTVIELHGVDLPQLSQQIDDMCRGFPIAVEFNGRQLHRPDAPDALPMQTTAVGEVFIEGAEDGKCTSCTRLYLQGFCVHQVPSYGGRRVAANVVHLDPSRFLARLPDRDKLIDEGEQSGKLKNELSALWRRILEARKASLAASTFVETFLAAMQTWGHLDLLDDVEVLPRELCDLITGYPVQERTPSCNFTESVRTAPTREDVRSGKVQLVHLDAPSDGSMAQWMLAKRLGHVILHAQGLTDTHWAQPHVRALEEEPATVEALGQSLRTQLQGRWIWPDVVLCERVRVQVGADVIELCDEGLFHDDTLFIPIGEHSGCAVQQASDFVDSNEHFHEEDMEADTDALADLIARHRAVDPVATLRAMLETLRLETYPLIQGRSFHLTVGADPTHHVVHMLE